MATQAGPSSPSQAFSFSTPSASAHHDPLTYPPVSIDSGDLPPMPVPYEDFHYSLNLPDDLDMSDLQFLGGAGDRKNGPSNPMTPGFMSQFLATTPHASHALEDSHMSSRAGSRRASISKSRPGSPKLGSFGLRPPPPPDFEPPPGSNLFASEMSGIPTNFGAQKMPNAVSSLFDSKEKSLLSNFLEGFEWDFDPSLPEGMPSFAAAAAERAGSAADAFGLQMNGPMLGQAKANGSSSSGTGSGSATTSSQSPHETSSSATSPPGSGRGHKRNKQSSGSMPRPPTHEADLVNAAFGSLPNWSDDATMTGSKRDANHLANNESIQAAMNLNSLSGMHAEMFRMSAGLDTVAAMAQDAKQKKDSGGKKIKTEHEDTSGSKRELLTESEKRQNHILSEQRRRNYIREGFKELVVLLDDGRSLGARALGLSSGFGSGVEDEGLDDRSDVSDGDDILLVGRKKPPKKAKKAGPNGARARGKGRGRGGSAGGGAGSKSAVLFQAVDLIRWLDGKNDRLQKQCEELEKLAGLPDPETIAG